MSSGIPAPNEVQKKQKKEVSDVLLCKRLTLLFVFMAFCDLCKTVVWLIGLQQGVREISKGSLSVPCPQQPQVGSCCEDCQVENYLNVILHAQS
jgi:hypothetical protein